jgi:agmatine deiminase
VTAPAAPPAALGYRLPAEWEPHAATWLAWPHARGDWPGKLDAVRWVYGEVVRRIAPRERVHLLVPDRRAEGKARTLLRKVGIDPAAVQLHHVPTDRSWTRDTLPLFVRRADGARGLVAWLFNAWARYPDWHRDRAAAARVARLVRLPVWKPMLPGRGRIVLEGGAIDVNGRGTLLATEECLLSTVQARNPGLGRAALERLFADFLGVAKVVWLAAGIAGDDTHGHVDDCARFVDPHTVVACVEPDRGDANHAPLAENLARLRAATDQDGRPLRVVELPMPAPLYFAGRRLPASYANFYVANAAVLVPTFNDERDRRALAILADCFPDRPVVGIHAVDLVWGLGAVHCITLQEPAEANA